MNDKKKITLKQQFEMNSQEACEKAIKGAWIAGLVSLSITLIFGTLGFFTQSDNETLNYFLDPWILIDVALMAVLIFFIYKKSRIAATSMFLYFVMSKCLQWYELETAQGLPMAMIFIMFYFNGMRGTFVWHAKYNKMNEAESMDVEPS